ncbi:MAG: hypothetical protein CL842_12890 [Crocinitomicaceae bacterium]|nr:hypothetical protein [Crocinitomicaceae bacterium]
MSGSLGFRAVYVSLVDSTGDFIWTVRGTSGQSFANQANGISLDTSKNIYCTGLAQPPLFFGDKIFSLASGGGGNDAYIVKFADCSEATKAKIFSEHLLQPVKEIPLNYGLTMTQTWSTVG